MMLDDRREAFYEARCGGGEAVYPAADAAAARLMVDLLLTCDVVTQVTGRVFAHYGLSRSTFNVLMLLRHGPPEGMQLHDIGELLLVSRANITGLIDQLENKGFVTRETPPNDRRVRNAKITAKAEATLDQCAPVHQDQLAILLSDLTEQEKLSTLDRLKKVRTSVRQNAARLRGEPWETSRVLVEREG